MAQKKTRSVLESIALLKQISLNRVTPDASCPDKRALIGGCFGLVFNGFHLNPEIRSSIRKYSGRNITGLRSGIDRTQLESYRKTYTIYFLSESDRLDLISRLPAGTQYSCKNQSWVSVSQLEASSYLDRNLPVLGISESDEVGIILTDKLI